MPTSLDRIIEIDLELAEIDDHTKRLKAERAGLELDLLEDWADRGQSKATVNGRTLYVRHDFHCNRGKDFSLAEVIEAMQKSNLGHLVSEGYSASALKSRVCDWINEDPAGVTVPEKLRKVLKWDFRARLVSIKAGN